MTKPVWADLETVTLRVCEIAAEEQAIDLHKVTPESRLIEDLHCDSLALVELIMAIEEEFGISLPDRPEDPVGKKIFVRQPFRLCDLAELVYINQGNTSQYRSCTPRPVSVEPSGPPVPFTQLSGTWTPPLNENGMGLFEPLESKDGFPLFRRQTDGMRCVLLPKAQVSIGNEGANAQKDEGPVHRVHLDRFLMDAEPVSATAFCRFLNSVTPGEQVLGELMLTDAADRRIAQRPVFLGDDGWRPVAGCERMPMVLVSWYGANAYSLWAHGEAWHPYYEQPGFLPTEAQWEYAARGARAPVAAQHARGTSYTPDQMPMAPVNERYGVSDFGLHHMAGNVWNWCLDWFEPDFYCSTEASRRNALNSASSGVKSERGGSWIGPALLCRPSYRRARNPKAFGRCLGFRCAAPGALVSASESLSTPGK